ncbi:hypothetical protein ACTXT7_010011 [Hymenolepis weldensis]
MDNKLALNFYNYRDNLQRKYGELSGEIVIVEITIKEIQEILAVNKQNSSFAQVPQTPRGVPTVPVTSFQKPSIQANQRASKSLGISLCGNKDLNQMAVLVCGLRPGSIAEVDGRIAVGDQLLELNEHTLYGRSHLNAGPLIRSCLLSVLHRYSGKKFKPPTSLCFVICRNPENLANMAVAPLSYATASHKVIRQNSADIGSGVESSSSKSTAELRGSPIGRSTFEEVHATRLLRGRNGFGFAIMDKSFTNEPGIYIKQLVENGPAALEKRCQRYTWEEDRYPKAALMKDSHSTVPLAGQNLPVGLATYTIGYALIVIDLVVADVHLDPCVTSPKEEMTKMFTVREKITYSSRKKHLKTLYNQNFILDTSPLSHAFIVELLRVYLKSLSWFFIPSLRSVSCSGEH